MSCKVCQKFVKNRSINFPILKFGICSPSSEGGSTSLVFFFQRYRQIIRIKMIMSFFLCDDKHVNDQNEKQARIKVKLKYKLKNGSKKSWQ